VVHFHEWEGENSQLPSSFAFSGVGRKLALKSTKCAWRDAVVLRSLRGGEEKHSRGRTIDVRRRSSTVVNSVLMNSELMAWFRTWRSLGGNGGPQGQGMQVIYNNIVRWKTGSVDVVAENGRHRY